MMVSCTLENFDFNPNLESWLRLLDACSSEGFDLDDYLFEIWKETLDV